MASTSICSVHSLAQSCGALTSVLTASLGPHGTSVLMERDGKIIITKDGVDILNSLQVDDPILTMGIKCVLKFAREHGDGSKSGIILMKTLFNFMSNSNEINTPTYQSHYKYGATTSTDRINRINQIKCIRDIKSKMLPLIKTKFVLEYCDNMFTDDPLFRSVCENFIYTSLSTQLTGVVSGIFTDLLTSYIFSNSVDYLTTIKQAIENSNMVIFQVYKTPVSKSQVINGIILSRDFKVLNNNISQKKSKFVLWSIPLLENKNAMTSLPFIKSNDCHEFMSSILYKNVLLENALQLLKTCKINALVSSEHFPDWAQATCRRHSIALVDMVQENEFTKLITELKILPICCQSDLLNSRHHCSAMIALIQLGTSRFAHVTLPMSSQIVITGITPTQCDQTTKAVIKTLKQLQYWFMDSHQLYELQVKDTSKILEEIPTLFRSRSKLYWCQCDSYAEIISSILLNNDDIFPCIKRKILSELLLSIPQILHGKAAQYSRPSFIKRVTTVQNFLLNDKKLVSSHFSSNFVQSPFQCYNIIDSVLQSAEMMLRIDSIITSASSISHYKVENDENDE